MWAVLVNGMAMVAGSLLGLVLGRRMNEAVQQTVMTGLGLSILCLAVADTLKSQHMMVLVVSLTLGGAHRCCPADSQPTGTAGSTFDETSFRVRQCKTGRGLCNGYRHYLRWGYGYLRQYSSRFRRANNVVREKRT